METQKATTQLIAHDKEVYDVAFAPASEHLFATCGADGSVRLFDLRSLEHSTIVYEETAGPSHLLRLNWNKCDSNYIATLQLDSQSALVLDLRMPFTPVARLSHTASVNAIAWAPHSSCHLCTGGSDSEALIWDISTMPKPIKDPILAYSAEGAINNLQWSTAQPDWVSIVFGDKMQILRV